MAKVIVLSLFVFLNALLPFASAAEPLTDVLKNLADNYGQARSMRDWVEKAPGLSRIERAALLEEPKFVGAPVPKVSFRKEKDGSLWFSVGSLELDVTNLRKGSVEYRGQKIEVHRGLFVQELAARLQKIDKSMRATYRFEFISSAYGAGAEGIANGCATKDLFTLYDIFNSPFGFVPHIWISAAAISVIRWTGDQFRNCETQVKDLRDLLRKGGLAVKSLSCGNDNWGADRKVEFWIPERDSSGEFKTRKFDLDYTNYFAREEAEVRSKGSKEPRAFEQRLYVFGTDRLKEVRLLEDKGGDFFEPCRVLSSRKEGKEAAEFAREKEQIEAYRKIFYYIGQYSTCYACRLVETRIVSPKPPSYFPAAIKPSPAGAKEGAPVAGPDNTESAR